MVKLCLPEFLSLVEVLMQYGSLVTCKIHTVYITGLPTLDESLEWEMRGAVRCQPIKSRKSQKSWWAGGGGHFFFSTSKFLPRFCRHIVGVPFVHYKPLTSNKKKNCVRDSYITVRAWECGEMRESHGQCARVGSPAFIKQTLCCHGIEIDRYMYMYPQYTTTIHSMCTCTQCRSCSWIKHMPQCSESFMGMCTCLWGRSNEYFDMFLIGATCVERYLCLKMCTKMCLSVQLQKSSI